MNTRIDAPDGPPENNGSGFRRSALWSWAAALPFGVSAAWVVLTLSDTARAGVTGLFVLLIVSAALTPLARNSMGWAWTVLRGRRRVAWLVTCLVLGPALTLAVPIDRVPPADFVDVQTLELTATGEKNASSAGSEVWVFEVAADGDPVALTEFTLDGSWVLTDDGALLSALQLGAESATWVGRAAEGIVVVALTHPYSGVVELSWGDETQRVDLYGVEGAQRAIELSSPPASAGWYGVAVFLSFSLAFALLLFVLGAWLVTRRSRVEQAGAARASNLHEGATAEGEAGAAPSRPLREPWRAATIHEVGKREWLMLALPPAIVWSLYLLAFWPAVMSDDSIDQWGQLLTGDYVDWHPAFHSLSEWLLTRPVESPAVIAAVQIVALSGVVGWSLASMRRMGMARGLAWVVSVAVALWPASGITVITLWKDVPYSIAVLALGVIILREVDGRFSVLDKPWGWPVAGGVAALVALFHHAGSIVAAAGLIALVVVARRREALGAVLVAAAAVLVVQAVVYPLADVERVEHPGIDSKVIHHIGAHLAAGTPLTADEQARVAELIPIPGSDWYDCRSVNAFIFHPNFDVPTMHEQAGEARALWWSLFRDDPRVDFEHLACSSEFVWRIRLLPGAYRYASYLTIDDDDTVRTIFANDFGLELDPVVSALTVPLARVVVESQEPVTAWLFWRGALYLYLLVGGAAVASLRSRDWRYWAVAVPALTIAAILVIAAPAQDFRYMYPVVLSGMLLGPFLLFSVSRRQAHEDERETEAAPTSG